jgi:hypothetical protein
MLNKMIFCLIALSAVLVLTTAQANAQSVPIGTTDCSNNSAVTSSGEPDPESAIRAGVLYIHRQRFSSSRIKPAGGTQLPVLGSGTAGQLTKWIGFNSTNSFVGDSIITETKDGKIGIGTTTPTSKLTVLGPIETTLGGLKFPDGTLQTTAAVSGLASVIHDSTLIGSGTGGSPLGISVPLNLTASVSTPVISITNNGTGDALDIQSFNGGGVSVTASISQALLARGVGAGTVGVVAEGAFGQGVAVGGLGLFARGGPNFSSGPGGDGIFVAGGLSPTFGGAGIQSIGGDSQPGPGQGSGQGGPGVQAVGGGASGPAGASGDGIFAQAGGFVGGAKPGFAGNFQGDVQVTGNLSKGGGSFKIDHPLDPADKYLYHSFVESPDMMNIYNGNVTTDAAGEAIVTLPDWFQALNRDFRYQLTVMGQFAQAIVARKIKDNTFTIKTSAPGVEVSWQVTGIRQDAWANAHRIPVEQDKSESERGYYLHPELFNQPEEKGIEWARHPSMMQRMNERRAQKRPQERN